MAKLFHMNKICRYGRRKALSIIFQYSNYSAKHKEMEIYRVKHSYSEQSYNELMLTAKGLLLPMT